MFQVPAVDITPYVEDGTPEQRAAVASAVDAACREIGFIQIHGHGIPEAVVAGLGDAMDAFFALELDAKRDYVRPSCENRGYTPPKSESLSLSLGVESASRMNDFFEAFNVGRAASEYAGMDLPVEHFAENTWPAVDGFESQVSTYFAEAGRVARTVTRIFADALGPLRGLLPRPDVAVDRRAADEPLRPPRGHRRDAGRRPGRDERAHRLRHRHGPVGRPGPRAAGARRRPGAGTTSSPTRVRC